MKIKGKTEKAYQLEVDGKKMWIPMSQSSYRNGFLYIEDWIAKKNGIQSSYAVSKADYEAYFSENNSRLILAPGLIKSHCSEVYEPNEIQIKSLIKCGFRAGFAFFLRQGLGKTKLCLDEIHLLEHYNLPVDAVVAVTPNNVKRVWIDEIKNLFLSKQYVYYKYDSATNKANKLARADFLNSDKKKFMIINYDAFISKQGKGMIAALLEKVQDIYLILDECHKVSNRKSQRGEWFRENVSLFTYRRLLSGTPFKNNLTEAWNIFKIIHPSIIKMTYWDFVDRYFHVQKEPFFLVGEVRQDRLSELQKLIEPYFIEAKDTDYLDLPETIVNTYYAELENDVEKEYIATIEEMYGIDPADVRELEDSSDTYLQALTIYIADRELEPLKEKQHLQQKLMQLGNGYIGNREDHRFIREDGSCSKIDVLEDLLEMYDFSTDQVIIVGTALPLLMKAALSASKFTRTSYLDGLVPNQNRDDIINDFKAGKTRILISNTTIIATGENLQCCNNMIFLNMDFRADEFDQVGKRIHRQGQKKTCYYTFIIGEGTIDEAVKRVVQRKLKNQDMLLKDKKQMQLGLYN